MRLVIVGLATSLLFTAKAAADPDFLDPNGFYRLPVPTGWEVETQDQGVSIKRGSAYAALWHVEGRGEAEGLIEVVAQNILTQWKDFEGVNAGECRLAGAAGFCAWYTGV